MEETKNYSFFRHEKCEYFPCHPTREPEKFNCLFCYCPLYALGESCGGNYRYLENGIKDCSACSLPHSPGGYDYVLSRYPQIAELARKDKT